MYLFFLQMKQRKTAEKKAKAERKKNALEARKSEMKLQAEEDIKK